MVMGYVFIEIRTECLNIMKASFGVKGLNKYKSDMSVKIIKVD
jgi:hypothetical protein